MIKTIENFIYDLKVIKMENNIMYIFVNDDLNMSKGLVVAQCCHITQIITDELVNRCFEIYPPTKDCLDYISWKKCPTTVVLKATNEQLSILKMGPSARHFVDSGNRLRNDSLTCVGFFPCNDMGDVVKNYKLY